MGRSERRQEKIARRGRLAEQKADTARQPGEEPTSLSVKRKSIGRPVGCLVATLGLTLSLGHCLATPDQSNAPTPKPTQQPMMSTRPPAQTKISAEQLSRNRARAKQLVRDEATVPRNAVETRLLLWNDITQLVPDNANYARRRDAIQKEVDDLAVFRENPEQAAEIVKVRGRKGGFGTVLIADLTIRNRGLSNLKDFVVSCPAMGPSGTVISEPRTTVYDTVEARSTRTIRNVTIGFANPQTKSFRCIVQTASIQ